MQRAPTSRKSGSNAPHRPNPFGRREFVVGGPPRRETAALQVLAVVKKLDQPVSRVCHRFDPLPQVTKNVRYRKGEESPTEDAKVCAAIASAEQRLKGYGRLIVRPSGTEPVIRVTAEGDDPDLIEEVVDGIVDALNEVAL